MITTNSDGLIDAKPADDRKASIRTCNAANFVRMKSDPLAKSLKRLERVKGIEPSYSAWKAAALPLSYTRVPPIT